MTTPILSNFITQLEAWGANAVSAGEQLAIGIITKFTGEEFAAVGAAASAFKTAKQAGQTDAQAWATAYNTLSLSTGMALSDAELGLADAIIELTNFSPTP